MEQFNPLNKIGMKHNMTRCRLGNNSVHNWYATYLVYLFWFELLRRFIKTEKIKLYLCTMSIFPTVLFDDQWPITFEQSN